MDRMILYFAKYKFRTCWNPTAARPGGAGGGRGGGGEKGGKRGRGGGGEKEFSISFLGEIYCHLTILRQSIKYGKFRSNREHVEHAEQNVAFRTSYRRVSNGLKPRMYEVFLETKETPRIQSYKVS